MNTCKIIEDLLPLYIEELTGEETSCFVREHLAECESCRGMYERMTAPVSQAEEPEVNYKKTLRWNMVKLVGQVLLVLALIAGLSVYFLWEIGWLDRYEIKSPNGDLRFEVLDNSEAGFFRGGAYVVTPDGKGRNLRGDDSFEDLQVFFSPDGYRYFAWYAFEDRDETYLVSYRLADGYRYAADGDSYFPGKHVEDWNFLEQMAEYLCAHPSLTPYGMENVTFAFDHWSDDSRRIYFDFSSDSESAMGCSGSLYFDCDAGEFVLVEAYVKQIRYVSVESERWDMEDE